MIRGSDPSAGLANPNAREYSPSPVVSALWIGQLSPLEQLCLHSFVARGHSVHLYTYDAIPNVPQGVTLQDAAQILPPSLVFRNRLGKGKGSLAAFSDLFRYKLLLDKGGWWVDADVFCLKAFDFAAPYVFGAEEKPVASGVLKMPRGCPLAELCYESARRVDPDTIVWNELVNILERGVRDLSLMPYVLPKETFSPIVWRDVPAYAQGEKLFAPSTHSYAVHLYNEMWRRNRLDKWRQYPPNSVLNVLRRHAQGVDEFDCGAPSGTAAAPSIWAKLRSYWPQRKVA
jgi:capsular polysaccharide synthesis protein